ncbi:hypothetical protein HYZ98_02345 [Candidatus Peregrinibacteria bacterium]|nr:hypothetical protein [Candidatus Peregrinibacteria bacterium]
MKLTASACGKIIVSGEYAVVFGYPGISVPAPLTLQATFEQTNIHSMKILWPEAEGTLWIPYLRKIIDLCIEPGAPYAGTLTIENTIPLQKGMGSSTALVIAISRALLGSNCKEQALSIEDRVNPGHSGLDFEVIWNKKPILFRKGKPPEFLDTSINQLIDTSHNFSLIDTGKPDQTTAELVAWVAARQHEPGVAAALQTIGHCTERLLKGEDIKEIFKAHHRAQVTLGIVPSHVQNFIAEIEESGGAAKVIGAGGRSGGGGIVLALAKNTSTLAASYGYRCLNAQHRLHQVLGE